MARGRISIDDGKCNELLFFAQFFSSVETSQTGNWSAVENEKKKKEREKKARYARRALLQW